MGLLPTKKSEKKTDNPKNLIIFGLPKVGKTTALSKLDNCLIIDLENGSDYIEGYVLKANNYLDLYNIAKALRDEQHSYKFVVLDTITALEDMALELGAKRYKEAPIGKSWEVDGPKTGKDLLKLPQGAGYYWLRIAMQEIISWFEKVSENLILVGHVKDRSLTEGGTELNVKSLDLSGKIGNILSAKSDAICYFYRDPETGNLMANFGDMNSVLCGSRMPHLAGKTILLAERIEKEDGTFDIVTHWDNIYPSLKK